MSRASVCHHCGDVIGVYEPMVAIIGGRATATAETAEPSLVSAAELRYHPACYAEVLGRSGPSESGRPPR